MNKQVKKIFKIIRNPKKLFYILGNKGFFNFLRDETYLKILYYCEMDKKLNTDNPTTYNEKLQWLKLNDRNPLYTKLADKYLVREYIAEAIGDEHLIPLLGVWDDPNNIDFNSLPNQFVLKCTHNSGGVLICTNKKKLNIKKTKKKLFKFLKNNYYWGNREWLYRNIKPRIIAEKYMVDESKNELKDYKFFCFNGEPKALFVATDRGIDTRFDFFDIHFNHMPFMQYYPNADKTIKKPKGFDEMIKLSKILSQNIIHVRVDFYDINGKIYFGELTFFHFCGIKKFQPSYYDKLFGNWLHLTKESNNQWRNK